MDASDLFKSLKGFFSNAPSKQAMTYAQGGFEASAYTKDRSNLWTGDNDALARQDGYSRQRALTVARYLVNNYSLFKRIASVTENYSVGAGLFANATTSDETFNALATSYFDRWADNAFCTSNQQLNFYQAQKLLAKELVIAGEVFLVLIKSPVSGHPQIMLVNSECVRKSDDSLDNSINGLYADAYGKIAAYNIFTGQTYQKVDASNVIHIIDFQQIGQLRGFSMFTPALNSAIDHKDCMILEKKAIKNHSAIAIARFKDDGTAGTGTFGALMPNQFNNDGTPSTKPNRGIDTAFGGSQITLNKGENIKLLAGDRSTEGFARFVEMLSREVCQSISLPYELLVNNEKQSGSGIRLTIADASIFFANIQNTLIDAAVKRVYSWVICSAINDGELPAPKGFSLDDPSTFPWCVSFTPPISITVDQGRVSAAEIAYLQNGLLNFESFYSSRGKDWKAEVKQRAIEEAYLNELSKQYGVDINRLRTMQAGSAQFKTEAEETEIDKGS